MCSKKIVTEQEEKPTETNPSSKCEVDGCRNNLFGYCQITPNIDKEGKCIIRRDR